MVKKPTKIDVGLNYKKKKMEEKNWEFLDNLSFM